jgi:8-oxo-dGTP pyrophosphatase MutT (NUDIX family)
LNKPHIENVAEIDVRLQPRLWDFASDRAAEIEDYWQTRLQANPHLYNGKVLLAAGMIRDASPAGDRLSGTCFVVDYKAFLAWRAFGQPGTAQNLFALAALRSADGAYLLGEMAPWTANAGQIYAPGGTPDLNDLIEDRLDLEGSVLRELGEETGLSAHDVSPVPGWTIVHCGALICCMKELRSPLTAGELVKTAADFFAREKKPELTRLVPVFGAADITPHMPDFMQAYLRHAFGADQG